jgi:FolB domain-containing protein
MDIILIEELTVFCIIGLLPHERRNPQYVHVDIRISIPQRQHEDTLEGSVDYCHISSWIEGFLLEEKFLTLEKACQDLI